MERRARIGSTLLLAVYLTALAGVFMHRHESAAQRQEPECEQCVNHMPHAGHLTAFSGGLSDCVLCHFLGLPYVYTRPAALVLPAFVYKSIDTLEQSITVSAFSGLNLSRAPPVSECFLSL